MSAEAGGRSALDAVAWRKLVLAADPAGSLDAALLLRRTGTLLAAWTRGEVPVDVVSVMAATLVGSVETMVGAVHCASPRTIRMETEQCQMLAARVDPKTILVLIAPSEVREAQIRQQARQIAAQVAGEARDARRLVPEAALVPRS